MLRGNEYSVIFFWGKTTIKQTIRKESTIKSLLQSGNEKVYLLLEVNPSCQGRLGGGPNLQT